MGEVEDKGEWKSICRPEPRWRNHVGDFWRRSRRYLIEEFDWGVSVSEWDNRGVECIWSEDFRYGRFDYSHPSGVEAMASQWISRAVTKQQQTKQVLRADDNTLYKDRPALAEYMTLVVDDEGNARDPSVLMVCATATGLKVGLKDAETGGWLWREAETLVKALNSLEAVLQSGEVHWAVPGGKNGKKR